MRFDLESKTVVRKFVVKEFASPMTQPVYLAQVSGVKTVWTCGLPEAMLFDCTNDAYELLTGSSEMPTNIPWKVVPILVCED